MKPVCQYDHRRLMEEPTHPELRAILDGRGELFAWQCPVCLRAWRRAPGVRECELEPLDPAARRRAMMEAAEEVQK